MLNIFKQKQTAFGLDLSDVSIKAMQLEFTGSSYKVLAYGDRELPKGALVNDVVIDEKALLANLDELLKKLPSGKISTNKIVASIPESKAFVRVIQIPKMSEDQAAAAVPFEAEQYIPIPLDQVYLDWEIIGSHEDKLDVLVTASSKEYVDSLLRLFKKSSLQPVAFEVESAACARSLIPSSTKDSNALILDMDTYRTSLIVVENSNLQFTSSVPIAGDAFTQSIARALSITAEEAEKTKRNVGLSAGQENEAVRSALSPVVDNLVAEIRNIIKFHDEHSSKQITQILLCGGTAKLTGLGDYLHEKLSDHPQLTIAQGNPWTNVFNDKLKGSPPLDGKDSLSYTTVIGLAMRGAKEIQ